MRVPVWPAPASIKYDISSQSVIRACVVQGQGLGLHGIHVGLKQTSLQMLQMMHYGPLHHSARRLLDSVWHPSTRYPRGTDKCWQTPLIALSAVCLNFPAITMNSKEKKKHVWNSDVRAWRYSRKNNADENVALHNFASDAEYQVEKEKHETGGERRVRLYPGHELREGEGKRGGERLKEECKGGRSRSEWKGSKWHCSSVSWFGI